MLVRVFGVMDMVGVCLIGNGGRGGVLVGNGGGVIVVFSRDWVMVGFRWWW